MRKTIHVLVASLALVACDVSKSVGDESTTGEDSETSTPTESATIAPPGSSTGIVSGTATTGAPSGTGTASAGGLQCPPFDPGPSDEPGFFAWECYCSTCTLSYEDISLDTVDQFEDEGLCSCLCAQNGCGDVEGEGGITGGAPTETGPMDSGDTEWSTGGGATTDITGTDTEGGVPLTYQDCLDEGGSIEGDPGDGSVFEPDYVCADGQVPMGILEFEPGMPFPKNGGVCCPPQ